MSLRVWLPLTKDLRNQGLDDITVTNNGAIFNSAGKLGGCYSFNGSSYITVQDIVLQNIWSYSCWLYSDISSRSWETVMTCNINGGDADMQLGLYTCPGGNVIQNTANGQYNASIPMTYGQWNHFVGTFDGTNLKTYLNGVLINTKTITNAKLDRPKLTIGARCRGSSYDCYFQGLLNDIRIYDHCLSLMEVKEISKGLILHYPLNRGGFGVDNILVNTHFDSRYTQSTGWDTEKNGTQLATSWGGYNGGVSNPSTVYHAHLKEFNGEWVYEYIKTANESWLGISQGGLNSKLIAGKTYTFSWEQYCVSGSNYVQTGLYYFKTGATSANFHLGLIYGNVGRELGKWQKFSRTFIAPEDGDYSKNMSWYIYGASGNGIVYVRHPKLEEGSKATPWCPNEVDALATTMGLNDNIEYDTSGYGNNGTRTGIFNWTSDTPKYQVSSVFDSSSIIDTPVIITSTSLISQYTAAVWIKRNNIDTTNNHCFFTGPIELFVKGSTSHIRFYWSHATSTSSMVNNTWDPSVTINNSIWTHIVVTFADGVLKCYINGELFNTSDRSSTGQYIYGNKYHTIGSYHDTTEKFIGQICDVRAYATALSAEDVKSLYNNSAYIDNQGNIYGAVYEEV